MASSESALKESIKLLPKNGKLFALIAISSIVLNSLLFLLFNYSIQPILSHIITTITQPGPGQDDRMKEDIAFLLADGVTYSVLYAIVAFFITQATIVVSAMSYMGNTMSFKDLLSAIHKTWIRTLLTMFYSSGMLLGYAFCVVLILAPFGVHPSPTAHLVGVVIGLPCLLLSVYFAVSWTLAIPVSVVEENSYGGDALGRASRLVKGKRLHGFMLNLGYNIVNLILSVGSMVTIGGVLSSIVYWVVMVSFTSLLNILLMVVYTVFYFQCMKHHGEETGEILSGHYAKLLTGPANGIV